MRQQTYRPGTNAGEQQPFPQREERPQEAAPTPMRQGLISGGVTGIIAGVVMAVALMAVFTLFLGRGPLYPVQVIGSALFGEAAFVGTHWGAVFVGLMLHMFGPSLFWGAVYGWAATAWNVRTPNYCLLLGLGLGIASMIVDVYLLVPVLMNALHGTNLWSREVPMLWGWAAHLIYGACFFLYPAVYQRVASRR